MEWGYDPDLERCIAQYSCQTPACSHLKLDPWPTLTHDFLFPKQTYLTVFILRLKPPLKAAYMSYSQGSSPTTFTPNTGRGGKITVTCELEDFFVTNQPHFYV